MIFLRPDTNDAEIWDEVFTKNCYRLPEHMQGWVVLDVGAHIGSFARAAAMRGAVVRSYEPAKECAQPFSWNTAGLNVSLGSYAVGSADEERILIHCPSRDERSGHSIFIPHPNWGRSEMVRVLPFKNICHGEVDLCKLDCEGAEYTILNDTPDDVLRLVRRWVIEFHAFDHFQIPWERISKLGFDITWVEARPHFVTAWFTRRDVSP